MNFYIGDTIKAKKEYNGIYVNFPNKTLHVVNKYGLLLLLLTRQGYTKRYYELQEI